MRTYRQRLSFGLKLGLRRPQAARLARLATPAQVQDFIDAIPINFEPHGDTCRSVREALHHRRAHCIEAAFVAACALWMQGRPPLVLDLQAKNDSDHVVALFRRGKQWGAISKSNHIWLRWRDPVYRTMRELALSYFHEYVGGHSRTLMAYSVPIDLRRFAAEEWITNPDDCWPVAEAVDSVRHYRLLAPGQARELRGCDAIERRANRIVEYRKPRRRAKF
ncbi:MAG TPA: hypothetical protein VMV79_01800 [Alphaproteobacteria bacterium]|nr:hypothetical protein [Alphaproteobacteria bacterium]